MITFLILLFAIIAVVILAVIALGAGGIVFIMAFGDLLVAGAIIFLIVRAIVKKH